MLFRSHRIIFAGLLAAAFSQGAAAATLVYCSESSPEGFDPALYTSGTTFDATSRNIYNRMIEFERGTTELVPALAESWEISEDGKTYTFTLREGVKFHTTDFFEPSRDFTAEDVVFSLQRQGQEDHPMHSASSGTYEYFNSTGMPGLIESIEAVDDLTVKFTLARADATFLPVMAMDFASVMSAEYADQLIEADTPELLNQQPVGTGPFQFQAYQKDAVIRYMANPDYWAGVAPLDALVFAITPDASVRYQKLKAGECHVMPYPNPADIDAIRAEESIELQEKEGFNVGYMAYNTQMEPFDNPAVRKALNMAINKQAILDVVFQGSGKIAKNPIPPTMWSYDDSIEDDAYDPEAAKQMLADEGVENLEMKLWAMPVQRPYNPNARRMAELIQEDFSQVGVKVEIVTYDWAEYLEKSAAVDRDGAVLLGWTADIADPDNFLGVLLGCDAVGNGNRAQWCHEPFDELIKEAKTLVDQDERTALYEQAQEIFKEQAPWATIAHSIVQEPVRAEVKDYRIDPFGGHLFYGVEIAE